MRLEYRRAELIADGVVMSSAFVFTSDRAPRPDRARRGLCPRLRHRRRPHPFAGLLSMLYLSATYNLLPVSRAKSVLHRSITPRSIC